MYVFIIFIMQHHICYIVVLIINYTLLTPKKKKKKRYTMLIFYYCLIKWYIEYTKNYLFVLFLPIQPLHIGLLTLNMSSSSIIHPNCT